MEAHRLFNERVNLAVETLSNKFLHAIYNDFYDKKASMFKTAAFKQYLQDLKEFKKSDSSMSDL